MHSLNTVKITIMKNKSIADSLADLISQAEAARIRGVSRASINQLIKRGRLTSTIIAGKHFVYRSEIMKFREKKPGPKQEVKPLKYNE